jgi:hypothetical protein
MTVAQGSGNGTQHFPAVEAVTVEWEECRRVGEEPPTERGAFSHVMRTADGTFEPMLPCSNPDCRDGGFEILEVVESMVSDRQEDKARLLVCIGWEHTKGGQTEQSPCTRVISYRIRLTYRKRGSVKPTRTKERDRDT